MKTGVELKNESLSSTFFRLNVYGILPGHALVLLLQKILDYDTVICRGDRVFSILLSNSNLKSEVWLMSLALYSDNIDEYMKKDDIVNFENENITQLADSLFADSDSEVEYIKKAYEFVRDNISHSADVNEDILICSASEVLAAGHGICFAKSHLLAALLRCKSIPSGFCYQKLILDDETAPVLVYHGLNAVYIKECKTWIRLDARGNKEGVNAQFSLDREQLAFPVRTEKGEEDGFVIYPDPDIKILEKFKNNKTRTELWDDLPTELGYIS